MAGIGPATSPLPRECSTTEPHGHGPSRNDGAGNEARTRDLNLGKVALYQLSYSRGVSACRSTAWLAWWNTTVVDLCRICLGRFFDFA